jgi:cysteine desulfurase
MSNSIYLDHNATTPLRPQVVDAMTETMRQTGNASSVHGFGRAARARIEEARDQAAALVNAEPANIVFTGGGTEANNTVLRGSGRKRLLVSAIEHESVRLAGAGVETVPVMPDGLVDLDALEKQLASSDVPALVSVMLANNETGVIQPVADVVRVARAARALVHCDAVQAAGKVAIDIRDLGVGFLTLSAHKFGGPQGVGAIVLGPGASFEARQLGGGQERGRRAGTENVAGIVGFGVAAAIAARQLDAMTDLGSLRDAMEATLTELSPEVRVFGAGVARLPNTSCLCMPGVASTTQLMALDLAGIAVSAGAACSSGKTRISPVLSAMGASEADAASAIRVSLGWTTVAGDIERFVAAWQELYRRRSPAARPETVAA